MSVSPFTGTSHATLTGTTSVAVNNGVATFVNLSVNQVGTWILTGKDTQHNLTANSTRFVISAATKLAITSPTLATVSFPGTTLGGLTVAVETSGSAIDTLDDTTTVTLALATAPSGSSLTGTLMVKVTNGVATFNDFVFSDPGIYTLKATAAGLASATSLSFVME